MPPIFILTVPNKTENQKRFDHCAATVKQLGFGQATPIEGINFHRFYPTDEEIKAKHWTLEQKKLERQKGVTAVFQEYRKHKPTFQFPAEFEKDAIGHLDPGQVAVYLGHWSFWEKAAQLPEGQMAVILEDDAQLRATSDQMNALAKHLPTKKNLVNLYHCNGKLGQFGMPNTLGYALSPSTARLLMQGARGDIPVDWAINKLHADGTISGGCHSPALVDKGFGFDNSTKRLL